MTTETIHFFLIFFFIINFIVCNAVYHRTKARLWERLGKNYFKIPKYMIPEFDIELRKLYRRLRISFWVLWLSMPLYFILWLITGILTDFSY